MLIAKFTTGHATCWYNDVITITNLEVLKIISFFDTFDIKTAIDDLHILSADDIFDNPDYQEMVCQYKQYLLQVYNGISEVIKKANEQYGHIIFPVVPVPDLVKKAENDTENDLQSSDSDNDVIKYVIEKLQEIDYAYYKNLNVDNYEEFINGTPEGIPEFMKQWHFNKIRGDIKKVIEASPKLLDSVFDDILW